MSLLERLALLLSDLDPDWAEKKLEEEFKLRRKKQAERLRLEALRLQRERAEEETRLRKGLADQREAREIAAAMLRDYALRERGVPCRTLPLIPDQELVDAVVRPGERQAWAERQRMIAETLGATVSRALYVAGTGNCTFARKSQAYPSAEPSFAVAAVGRPSSIALASSALNTWPRSSPRGTPVVTAWCVTWWRS